MKFLRATGLGLTFAALAACSGGTGASVAPIAKSPTVLGSPSATVATVRVKAVIHIPRSKKNTKTNKSRKYVSPSTEGLIIAVNQVTQQTAAGAIRASLTGYDLTKNSASNTCSEDQNGNDCTIYLNAPATSSTSSDQFQIYAYDQAEPSAITSSSQVVGNLLSEDVGPAGSNGDPVPGSMNPNGISATGTNTLTFILNPVVAVVEGTANGLEDGPFGSQSQIVLSVPGTGGSTSAIALDGYDADGNQIQTFLSPAGGDDMYVNPITTSFSGPLSSEFSLASSNTLTSALSDTVNAAYTPGANDAPTSTSTSVPYATLTANAPFTGGFDSTTSYPLSTQTPAPIVIAPLYSYVPSTPIYESFDDLKHRQGKAKVATSHRAAVSGSAGLMNYVYALQYATPTTPSAISYSLTFANSTSSNNDCTEYSIDGPHEFPSTSVQSYWEVTITGTFPTPGTTCALTISDGVSSMPVTLTQNDTTEDTDTQIVTPQSVTQPLMPENQEVYSKVNSIAVLSYPLYNESATVGDTLVCIESYEGYGQEIAPSEGSTGNFLYYNLPDITGEAGMFVALYDVTSSTDELRSSPSDPLADQNTGSAPIFCGEYQNTSAAAIGQAIGLSRGNQLQPTNSTVTAPGARPQEVGDGAIVALASNDPTANYSETGYIMNTLNGSLYAGADAGLYVQSLAQVDQNTNILKPVITTNDPNEVFEGITMLIPLGPSAHAQFNMAKGRAEVIHAR